jgi:cutinase
MRHVRLCGQPGYRTDQDERAKTIKLCAPKDPVCSDGLNFSTHNPDAYDRNLTNQGAAFAASRLIARH